MFDFPNAVFITDKLTELKYLDVDTLDLLRFRGDAYSLLFAAFFHYLYLLNIIFCHFRQFYNQLR